jgi:predicted NUDIX family NTP pyrophosphohydrolase
VLQAPPSGAPEVTLLFIQYSRNPARRVASLRVAGGKLMLVHEGDTFEGMRVATIRSDALELEWGGTRFLMLAVR